jgi:transcription antitermination factor NusG
MRRYTNRSKKIEKAAFPGYIFCNFDLQDKVKILSSIGVSYIVGAGGVPVPVPESELSNTRRTIEAGGTPAPYLKVGQLVLVETGPLAGVEGVLMREAGRDRLVVSVHLLQRSIAINIARDDVRVIQPSLLKVGA